MQAPMAQKHVLTVSELTSQLKILLEDHFPFIWVTGEISNFRVPVSGHFYFSLKDAHAQINAVMFRGQNSHLKFEPEDGMQINGLGRISLYEPRGTYQIILEHMEPKGVGALQVAFEQLKEKLTAEGLFDEKHKRPLPFLPNKICVITSLTGAVIHDIIRVLNRRFSNIPLEIIPAKVQGGDAEKELIQAIQLLNRRSEADVAILARGGGSLEDLQPFNTEGLARAIFSAKIPIISAIGHETDFTLADFVADQRAPTPSAAAEIVAPLKSDLKLQCADIHIALNNAFYNYIKFLKTYLGEFSKRLIDPRRRIQDIRLRTDDLFVRLTRAWQRSLLQRREHLYWRTSKLETLSPLARLPYLKNKLEGINHNLSLTLNNYFEKLNVSILDFRSRLIALSPLAILKRGYSITRTLPGKHVLRDAGSVSRGAPLQILLGNGYLEANVTHCSRTQGADTESSRKGNTNHAQTDV